MKRKIIISVFTILLFTIGNFVSAQENITIVTPSSEVAEGLDLYAVAELFKDAENLEEFENALNNPEIGINNLDLNDDGYVDYIRVVEQFTDYTHVIILQVPFGEDEFQDIATIEIEKTEDDNYNMQVHGNEVIYGVDYYVSPVYVHIHSWPVITWIYRPYYRPYWSVFYFGYYPHWWKPYRPVAVHVYHTRTHKYSRRAGFHVTRVNRVETVHKVNYKPHTSPRVKKRIEVVHPSPGDKAIPRITQPTRLRRETPAVKKGMETTDRKTIKPKVKVDTKKTIRPRVEKNITDRSEAKKRTKSEVKKSTKPKVEKRATVKREVKKNPKPRVEKRTTVKSGIKRTTKPRVKKSPTFKREAKKTTKPKVEKKTTIKKDNNKTTVKKKKNNN